MVEEVGRSTPAPALPPDAERVFRAAERIAYVMRRRAPPAPPRPSLLAYPWLHHRRTRPPVLVARLPLSSRLLHGPAVGAPEPVKHAHSCRAPIRHASLRACRACPHAARAAAALLLRRGHLESSSPGAALLELHRRGLVRWAARPPQPGQHSMQRRASAGLSVRSAMPRRTSSPSARFRAACVVAHVSFLTCPPLSLLPAATNWCSKTRLWCAAA